MKTRKNSSPAVPPAQTAEHSAPPDAAPRADGVYVAVARAVAPHTGDLDIGQVSAPLRAASSPRAPERSAPLAPRLGDSTGAQAHAAGAVPPHISAEALQSMAVQIEQFRAAAETLSSDAGQMTARLQAAAQHPSVLGRSAAAAAHHLEVLKSALRLVPSRLPHGDPVTKKAPTIQLCTPHSVANAIRDFLPWLQQAAHLSLVDLPGTQLLMLWDRGDGLVDFGRFVEHLASLDGVPIVWHDGHGARRTQTAANGAAKLRMQETWDKSMLRGGRLIATSDADAKTSAHARVNPATALAVACLAQNDHDSFARIIATHPARIIADLLNGDLFTQGAIFSDRNIWGVMAHALAAEHAAGSSADSLEALTLAAENFLRYHNVPKKQAPRGQSPKNPQPHAAGGQFTLAHQADALSQTADRIWTSIAPTGTKLRHILDLSPAALQMQAELGALLLNVFLGAVDLHMRNASGHRPRGAGRLKKVVQAISAATSRADRAPPPPRSVRDITSDNLAQTTASFSKEPADGLVGAHAPLAPEALRRRYARAYAGAIEMADRSYFVAGQRIIRHSAAPVVADGSIRAPAIGPRYDVDDDGVAAALQSDPTGLREDERAEIKARRAIYGRRLAEALRAAAPMNRYTPKI